VAGNLEHSHLPRSAVRDAWTRVPRSRARPHVQGGLFALSQGCATAALRLQLEQTVPQPSSMTPPQPCYPEWEALLLRLYPLSISRKPSSGTPVHPQPAEMETMFLLGWEEATGFSMISVRLLLQQLTAVYKGILLWRMSRDRTIVSLR
jgi:hypothetical protein